MIYDLHHRSIRAQNWGDLLFGSSRGSGYEASLKGLGVERITGFFLAGVLITKALLLAFYTRAFHPLGPRRSQKVDPP